MGDLYSKKVPEDMSDKGRMVYAINLITLYWSLIRLRLAQGWSELYIALDLGVDRREIRAAPHIFSRNASGQSARLLLREICKNVYLQLIDPKLELEPMESVIEDWASRVMAVMQMAETSSLSELFPE